MAIEKSDTPRELPQGGSLFYCLTRSPWLGLTVVPYAEVAQVVEQWTENPCVPSSNLGSTTLKNPCNLVIAGVYLLFINGVSLFFI